MKKFLDKADDILMIVISIILILCAVATAIVVIAHNLNIIA